MPDMTNEIGNTETNHYSPKTLVKESKLFCIPLYQRPYAWEKEQVEQLLKDLLAAFTKNPHEDYHLGLLSVAKSVDARLDLIDGQQRMTTLMLIGKAANEFYSEWEGFLNEDRLKLYGREDDQEFLKSGSTTVQKVNLNMQNALACAKLFFSKELHECKPNEVTPKDFSAFIFEHATFFLAEVPPNYSPKEMNQHFVRMNNRGKQLEKHEILKTRLFKKLKTELKDQKFLDKWNEMVACLTGSGIAAGNDEIALGDILNPSKPVTGGNDEGKDALYSAILNIPEFLLIALSRTTSVTPEKNESLFEKDRLLETFKNKLGDDVSKIEEFMEVLEKQLDYLKKFFIFIAKSGERYELGECKEDKSSEVFDFGSDSDRDRDAERTKKHLVTLQSYLYVSTLPYHWLGLAFDYCKQQSGPKIDARKFIIELERIDNLLLSDKTRHISELKLPEMGYNNISHYWFYRLDYELWKLAQEKDRPIGSAWEKLSDKDVRKKLTDFRFRRSNSVEHINPQTQPVGGAWLDPVTGDSFGNIALISSSDNSKFSNHPAKLKRDFVMKSEKVYSLKMLHFLWCIDNFDATTVLPSETAKAIDAVGTKMFEILCAATNSPGCNWAITDSAATQT